MERKIFKIDALVLHICRVYLATVIIIQNRLNFVLIQTCAKKKFKVEKRGKILSITSRHTRIKENWGKLDPCAEIEEFTIQRK